MLRGIAAEALHLYTTQDSGGMLASKVDSWSTVIVIFLSSGIAEYSGLIV